MISLEVTQFRRFLEMKPFSRNFSEPEFSRFGSKLWADFAILYEENMMEQEVAQFWQFLEMTVHIQISVVVRHGISITRRNFIFLNKMRHTQTCSIT